MECNDQFNHHLIQFVQNEGFFPPLSIDVVFYLFFYFSMQQKIGSKENLATFLCFAHMGSNFIPL